MKLFRYEVYVGASDNMQRSGPPERSLRFATLERAEAAAAMAELLCSDAEVAINDLQEQTTIISNAGTEEPVYASQS